MIDQFYIKNSHIMVSNGKRSLILAHLFKSFFMFFLKLLYPRSFKLY
jgi:hypothetical protein